MNKTLLAITFAITASPIFAAGIDWAYTGDKPYAKALVVWTDDRYVGRIKPLDITSDYHNASNAVARAQQEIQAALKGSSPVSFDNLITLATANYNLGTVLAVEVPASATTQRIHHDNLYLAPKNGWGFSIFVNFDNENNITEYAMNDIGSGEIDSDRIYSACINIGREELTIKSVTKIGGELMKPTLARIDIKNSAGANARSTEEPDTIEVSINNAVKWLSYRVIDTRDLKEPFKANNLVEAKIAEADGELSFDIPLDHDDKTHFYKIELIE